MTDKSDPASTAAKALEASAIADPDFTGFHACYGAFFGKVPPPPELIDQAYDLLRHDPEFEGRIVDEHSEAISHKSITDGGFAFLALIFLLRTHIEIEWQENGEIKIKIVHEPIGKKELAALIAAIKSWLDDSGFL